MWYHYPIYDYISSLLNRSKWRSKKVLIYVVVWSSWNGVPKCEMQKEMTCKEETICAQGTLGLSHLKGDSRIDGLVALSYYDSKSFYMMSNSTDCIEGRNRKNWLLSWKIIYPQNLLKVYMDHNFGTSSGLLYSKLLFDRYACMQFNASAYAG